MTGAISASSRATEAPAGLRAAGWLRVSVLAAIVAAIAVAGFDLAVAERVVDRAVAVEDRTDAVGAVVAAEPFTRDEQRAGLALGGLLLAVGIGLVLAGAATLLGPRFRHPGRIWLGLAAAGCWAIAILPAIKYPALPPGVESSLELGERQLAYLGLAGAGVAGALAAAWAWRRLRHLRAGDRMLAGTALFLLPAIVAVIALPAQGVAASADPGLLRDFRLVSIGGQLIFWTVLAAAGLAILTLLGRRSAVGSDS